MKEQKASQLKRRRGLIGVALEHGLYQVVDEHLVDRAHAVRVAVAEGLLHGPEERLAHLLHTELTSELVRSQKLRAWPPLTLMNASGMWSALY